MYYINEYDLNESHELATLQAAGIDNLKDDKFNAFRLS